MTESSPARLSRRAALPLGAALVAALAQAGLAGAQSATPLPVEAGRAGYVVIRRYHVKPGATYAELTRLVETEFVPIIREVPGFVEYLLIEPGNDEHIVLSIFADQAGADESAVLAREWAQGAVGDLVELPAYEVISGAVGLNVVASADAEA